MFLCIFTSHALVRPHLEYTAIVWSTHSLISLRLRNVVLVCPWSQFEDKSQPSNRPRRRSAVAIGDIVSVPLLQNVCRAVRTVRVSLRIYDVISDMGCTHRSPSAVGTKAKVTKPSRVGHGNYSMCNEYIELFVELARSFYCQSGTERETDKSEYTEGKSQPTTVGSYSSEIVSLN